MEVSLTFTAEKQCRYAILLSLTIISECAQRRMIILPVLFAAAAVDAIQEVQGRLPVQPEQEARTSEDIPRGGSWIWNLDQNRGSRVQSDEPADDQQLGSVTAEIDCIISTISILEYYISFDRNWSIV